MRLQEEHVGKAPAFSQIVVLGHSGYIGSRLTRALAAVDPRVPVVGKSVRELDLTRPESTMALEAEIDARTAVVILAAIKKQLGDTAEAFAQNLAIVLNVARALESTRPRRVVFFSSAAVYGEDVAHDLITEATPVQPTSFYGIGKYAAERLLLRIVGTLPDTTLLILRPALVYGPHEPAYYYGPSGFLRKAIAREPITIWGDGEELREFLLVDDVVEVAKRLTFTNASGVLNVVSGTSYTFAQALDVVAAIAGQRPATTSRPRSKNKVDHRFEATALHLACPAFTFTPLEAGVRTVAEAAAAPVERAQA